jgi:hypothetical protein
LLVSRLGNGMVYVGLVGGGFWLVGGVLWCVFGRGLWCAGAGVLRVSYGAVFDGCIWDWLCGFLCVVVVVFVLVCVWLVCVCVLVGEGCVWVGFVVCVLRGVARRG